MYIFKKIVWGSNLHSRGSENAVDDVHDTIVKESVSFNNADGVV